MCRCTCRTFPRFMFGNKSYYGFVPFFYPKIYINKEVQIMDNITASGAEKTKKDCIIFTSTWEILLWKVKRNRVQAITDTLYHDMQCITKYIWRTG